MKTYDEIWSEWYENLIEEGTRKDIACVLATNYAHRDYVEELENESSN